jgi:hypothetical protein
MGFASLSTHLGTVAPLAIDVRRQRRESLNVWIKPAPSSAIRSVSYRHSHRVDAPSESGTSCVSLETITDCGSLGYACLDPPSNGTAYCVGNTNQDHYCLIKCSSGFALSDGVCLFTTTLTDCGSLGNKCPDPENGSAICDSGFCGAFCDPDIGLFNGECVATTSITNCGSIGNDCQAPEDGQA